MPRNFVILVVIVSLPQLLEAHQWLYGNSLEKPESLQEGKRYFQIQNGGDKRFPLLALVTFLAYTSCPAVVVVQTSDNSRVRCSREELYNVSPKYLIN